MQGAVVRVAIVGGIAYQTIDILSFQLQSCQDCLDTLDSARMRVHQGKVNRLSCEQRQQRQTQRRKRSAASIQDVDDLLREPLLSFPNCAINAAQINDGSSQIKQAASGIQGRNSGA